MIKTIMFDLGEVFFTINHKKLDEEMIEKTGVTIRPAKGTHHDFYVDFVAGKISIEEYFDNLRKAVNSDAPIELLNKVYSEAYIKYSIIDQGMLELAKKLKNKYQLICITNTNLLHKNINKKRGLMDVFDKVFSSTEAKRLKDTSWFKDILLELKLEGSSCIFIDDSKENVAAAEEAGINPILFVDEADLISDLAKFNIYP